jgi:hypothetical protein
MKITLISEKYISQFMNKLNEILFLTIFMVNLRDVHFEYLCFILLLYSVSEGKH